MIDVTKPRSYIEILENWNEGCWFRLKAETNFVLPLEVFSWFNGCCLKYVHDFHPDGTEFCYGDDNLYTDYPAVAVLIEDCLYYISVSENPKILAEYPPEYKEQVREVLDFVRTHHECLSLHWYGELRDDDICDVAELDKKMIYRGERDYEYKRHIKQCRRITEKLKQLKDAGKFHGDI